MMTIVFLGPPASGKGTQAARFASAHGFTHFDMGGALREEIESGSALASEIRSYADAGKLVPGEIVRKLVEQMFGRNQGKNVLLDGFPRSSEQADMLDDVLAVEGRELNTAVLVEVPEEVLMQRVINRRFCPECGRVYNLQTLRPQGDGFCDDDGAQLMHRRDDTEEVMAERLRVYYGQTQPIVERYEQAGILSRVDGTAGVESVSLQIERIVFV